MQTFQPIGVAGAGGQPAPLAFQLRFPGAIEGIGQQSLDVAEGVQGLLPDLNQVVLHLLVESQAGIPLLMASLGGNVNDAAGFRDTIAAHVGQLQTDGGLRYLVADSALYNAETLRELDDTVWISRVPETLGTAREMPHAVTDELMQAEAALTYRAVGVVYAGLRQRWLIVFSRQARQRAEKTLQRQHLKQSEAERKAFDALCRQGFACEADAQAALDAFAQGLKLTTVVEGGIVARTRHAQKGRPAKGQMPTVVRHAITGQFASRLDIHARRLRQKSSNSRSLY
ncbi:MAG: IS1634 family transposase, partial [Candidatus Competibacteraceae bacterium]|nr:IS1634 family transposase [Candidatus Competibacteraceae bacterium]